MKVLFWAGLLLLILGLGSLVVPIPRSERGGFEAGGVSVGVETRHEETVPALVSAAMILSGAGLMISGKLKG